MCMINEMANKIKELEQENSELKIACEGYRAQRDAAVATHEKLMFKLIDAVKLAAVVAYPGTHRDADWRPMARSFMKDAGSFHLLAQEQQQ